MTNTNKTKGQIHNKTGKACLICDDNNKEGFTFHRTRRQTHRFCLECGVNYMHPILAKLIYNYKKGIRDQKTIRCPGSYYSLQRNQCKREIEIKNIIIIDNENNKGKSAANDYFKDVEMWLRLLNYMIKNSNSLLCSNEECNEIIDIPHNYNQAKVACPACKKDWCRLCGLIPHHHGLSCIEHEMVENKTETGQFLRSQIQKGNYRGCPKCRCMIERIDGCNKMICVKCGSAWCWLCRAIINGYQHFDNSNSTCYNKLWIKPN